MTLPDQYIRQQLDLAVPKPETVNLTLTLEQARLLVDYLDYNNDQLHEYLVSEDMEAGYDDPADARQHWQTTLNAGKSLQQALSCLVKAAAEEAGQ